MIRRHAASTAAALMFLALTTRIACAEPTKAQCITANTKAQSLRRDGKLAEARQQLQMCGDPKCPALVSTDCAKRLDELEGVQPTLIIDVRDASGHDLTDVRVTVDGQPLLDKLDGSATSPQRTVGYVVTGVGVAGLAVGGVFGYLALSAKSRQTANCSSTSSCSDYSTASTAHDSAKTNGTISTIAFAAGAAVATVGVVLIATAKPTHEAPATAALTLGAHAGPGKAELCLTGLF